jgi:hypothetical protein
MQGEGRLGPICKEKTMQFVLLIYQGTTPTPTTEGWKAFSEDEKKRIYAEYAELNNTPGVTPGLSLGLPHAARTVQLRNGSAHATEGPYLDAQGAVGGYLVLEADDLDAAIKLASRIPAARLGGAVEVRPVAKYW